MDWLHFFWGWCQCDLEEVNENGKHPGESGYNYVDENGKYPGEKIITVHRK